MSLVIDLEVKLVSLDAERMTLGMADGLELDIGFFVF